MQSSFLGNIGTITISRMCSYTPLTTIAAGVQKITDSPTPFPEPIITPTVTSLIDAVSALATPSTPRPADVIVVSVIQDGPSFSTTLTSTPSTAVITLGGNSDNGTQSDTTSGNASHTPSK